MLGPEPLAGLCDRLDMASEAPELTKLFELVLKEAADFHDSSSEGAEFELLPQNQCRRQCNGTICHCVVACWLGWGRNSCDS